MKRIALILATLLQIAALCCTPAIAVTTQVATPAFCSPPNIIANGQPVVAPPVAGNFTHAETCSGNPGDLWSDGPLYSPSFFFSGGSLNFVIPAMTWYVQGQRVYTPSANETAPASLTSYWFLDAPTASFIEQNSNSPPTTTSVLEYTVTANSSGITGVVNPAQTIFTPYSVVASTITDSGLTPGSAVCATTGGLLSTSGCAGGGGVTTGSNTFTGTQTFSNSTPFVFTSLTGVDFTNAASGFQVAWILNANNSPTNDILDVQKNSSNVFQVLNDGSVLSQGSFTSAGTTPMTFTSTTGSIISVATMGSADGVDINVTGSPFTGNLLGLEKAGVLKFSVAVNGIATSAGGTLAPYYTHTGGASPATVQCVPGTVTAAGASTAVSVAGAAFATFPTDIGVIDSTTGTPVPQSSMSSISTSGFTFASTNTHVYYYKVCGY